MTPIVGNEVHSLRDFETSYIKPLVKTIYDCLYSINYETGYQTTDILKDVIDASNNLNNAVDTYSELFGKIGEESQFRDAVNHMVIPDIVTNLDNYSDFSSERSSFSYQFENYTSDGLGNTGYTLEENQRLGRSLIHKLRTGEIDDYHEYVQLFIDGLADNFVRNGHNYDIVISNNPDKQLLFDTDDVRYLMSDESSIDVVIDRVDFSNPFTDIHGDSWLPCMIYYAHGDYTHGDYAPNNNEVKDERCVNEGYIGLAIPIDNTNNASINGTKLVFEDPVCVNSIFINSRYWIHEDDDNDVFCTSAEERRAEMDKAIHDDDPYEAPICHYANKAFNEFRLGAYKPDLFDDTGIYYVKSDPSTKHIGNEQSISVNTLDSLIQQYQNLTFEFTNASEFDTLSWDALNEFVPVVTEAKPSAPTPDSVVSELKPTDTVKYNKAVDTYDITDN